MNILIKEENEFKQQLEMADISQTSRVVSRRPLKKEKALKQVFENVEQHRDILYILRFGAYQCAKIGIEPVDVEER